MKKYLVLQQCCFWGKVIFVGVLVGFFGGGVVFGINFVISIYCNYVIMKVFVGLFKSGGILVFKNKVSLINEIIKVYNVIKNVVVLVINKQVMFSSDFLYGNVIDGLISFSFGSLEMVSEGFGVIYKKSGNVVYVVINNYVVFGFSEI